MSDTECHSDKEYYSDETDEELSDLETVGQCDTRNIGDIYDGLDENIANDNVDNFINHIKNLNILSYHIIIADKCSIHGAINIFRHLVSMLTIEQASDTLVLSITSKEMIGVLLDKGVEVDTPITTMISGNADNYTPLMISAKQEKTDITRFLIDNGADVNAVTENDHSALSIAIDCSIYFTDLVMVDLLVDNGADIRIVKSGQFIPDLVKNHIIKISKPSYFLNHYKTFDNHKEIYDNVKQIILNKYHNTDIFNLYSFCILKSTIMQSPLGESGKGGIWIHDFELLFIIHDNIESTLSILSKEMFGEVLKYIK